MFTLLTKCQPTGTFRPQTMTKTFTEHTDNENCNTWGLEAAAIPRRVKVQHIKGIAKVLTDSVSRFKAVGFCHDIDLKDHQQEFSIPIEPLPSVEPVTHMPLDMNEVFIAPDIKRLMQTYNKLHDSPTEQTNDDIKLSLEKKLFQQTFHI